MELYILRHAIAVTRGMPGQDARRALTSEGRGRLEKITQAWPTLGVEVDVIFTSPFVRALQTAEIAAQALGRDIPEILEALSAGAAPAEIIETLAPRVHDDDRVMLVGHEPDLGRLISMLVCGNDLSGFNMKKAGLSKLTVDRLHVGACAVLEWHLWPRHMLRMA